MISAMTFLILLLVLAAVLSVATVRATLHDGRSARPPRSHFEDPMLRSPGAW